MIIPQEFAFLKATRFWALVIGAVSIYMQMKGYIGEAEMTLITGITSGFTIIRTIDRATKQKILAEAVATKQISVSDILEIPPSKVDDLGGSSRSKKAKE